MGEYNDLGLFSKRILCQRDWYSVRKMSRLERGYAIQVILLPLFRYVWKSLY